MRATRQPSPLLKILALPATEVADLIVAQFYLLIAWATVRLRRRGDLLRTVSPNGPRSTRQDVGRLARVALAVDRVSRFGIIHPTCLVRAIALERMIHRVDAGPAVVRVGVLPGGQTLAAHAWIELDGRVVGDEPSFIRRFVPLSDFSAMRK